MGVQARATDAEIPDMYSHELAQYVGPRFMFSISCAHGMTATNCYACRAIIKFITSETLVIEPISDAIWIIKSQFYQSRLSLGIFPVALKSLLII